MIGLKAKLIAGAIVFAIISGLLLKDHFTVKRLNKARQDLAVAEARVTALEDARKLDTRIALELNTFRQQQTSSLHEFGEALRKSKITREIRYVDSKGQESVCTVRDPAEYQRLFNQAVREAASP